MNEFKCIIAVILLLMSIGCTATTNSSPDTVKNGENGRFEDEIHGFIDFSQKENWETAYPYMKALGNTAQKIADNYLDWEFIDGVGGAVIYDNPENGLQYWFHMTGGSLLDYYGKALAGDEVCIGIGMSLEDFFKDAVWPQNVEDTQEYLCRYLGLDFEFFPEDSAGGYWYYVELAQNHYTIGIYTETGLITDATGIGIMFGDEYISP